MPTGYTHAVQEGKITELKPFVLQCARAMGALIMMRDDSSDAEIPQKFEPSTEYHDEKIKNAQADIVMLAGLSPEDCQDKANEEYSVAVERWNTRRAERLEHFKRYTAMIEKVKSWNPPQQLLSLKDFMLDQLNDSVRFDCSDQFDDKPEEKTGAEWFEAKSKSVARDIEYHSKERAKEIHRNDERNLWVSALRSSL